MEKREGGKGAEKARRYSEKRRRGKEERSVKRREVNGER